MSEVKFKKPGWKFTRKTTIEDSDEDKSDDESLKLVFVTFAASAFGLRTIPVLQTV